MKREPAKGTERFYTVPKPFLILIHIAFILFGLACILPLLLILAVSFTDETSLLRNGYSFIPEVFSTLAYRFLFEDGVTVARAYGVTLFVTLVGTVISVLLSALYAYPLSRKDFPFKKFFTVFLLITMLFSGGLVPFYLVYVSVLDLKNSVWSLILPTLSQAFHIIIVRTFYQQNIPDEIIDSAKIDGSGEWRLFFQMILPLSMPVLATIGLFCSVGLWNNWFLSLLFIDDPKFYTLQYVMMQALLRLQFLQERLSESGALLQIEQQIPTEGVRMAMVIVATGPIILAYPFFQRFFVRGITVGAVKG